MRVLTLPLLAWLMHAHAVPGGRPALVNAADVSSGEVQIVGHLGLPLGTVGRVQGAFFDGSELRMKALDGVLLMRVTRVNGNSLPKPALFRFSRFQGGILPNTLPGREFDLLAYETGAFEGVPQEAWNYVPVATTTGHSFETSLVVLMEHPAG